MCQKGLRIYGQNDRTSEFFGHFRKLGAYRENDPLKNVCMYIFQKLFMFSKTIMLQCVLIF